MLRARVALLAPVAFGALAPAAYALLPAGYGRPPKAYSARDWTLAA